MPSDGIRCERRFQLNQCLGIGQPFVPPDFLSVPEAEDGRVGMNLKALIQFILASAGYAQQAGFLRMLADKPFQNTF